MKRIVMLPMAGVLALALAAPGVGQADDTKAQAQGQAQGQSSTQTEMKAPPAQISSESQAQANAEAQASAEAQLKARKTIDAIKQKGAQTSTQARAKAEAKLSAAAKKTNDDARGQGEANVAGRLAAEFGMTSEQLTSEQQTLGCSWGELMIAHSLQANSKTEVTAGQLVELHKEGTGWGQIAAGLGLKLGEAVSAVQAEGRVAAGLAKPDGKVAVIRGDGAHAGVGAGTHVGAQAAGGQAAAQAGVGVGVKIKP